MAERQWPDGSDRPCRPFDPCYPALLVNADALAALRDAPPDPALCRGCKEPLVTKPHGSGKVWCSPKCQRHYERLWEMADARAMPPSTPEQNAAIQAEMRSAHAEYTKALALADFAATGQAPEV